jgi:hypothetical protein
MVLELQALKGITSFLSLLKAAACRLYAFASAALLDSTDIGLGLWACGHPRVLQLNTTVTVSQTHWVVCVCHVEAWPEVPTV